MLIDVEKLENIKKGMLVDIIVDEYKKSEHKSRGFIEKIISKKDREGGVFVQINTGEKGAILDIISKDQLKKELFKFYNLFLHEGKVVTIWDRKKKDYVIIESKDARGRANYIALLYNDLDKAKSMLAKLNNRNFTVKGVSRKKLISDNFKDNYIDSFFINNEKRIKVKKLNELEEYFNKMG